MSRMGYRSRTVMRDLSSNYRYITLAGTSQDNRVQEDICCTPHPDFLRRPTGRCAASFSSDNSDESPPFFLSPQSLLLILQDAFNAVLLAHHSASIQVTGDAGAVFHLRELHTSGVGIAA